MSQGSDPHIAGRGGDDDDRVAAAEVGAFGGQEFNTSAGLVVFTATSNVTFTAVTAEGVPEPMTLSLFGAGLLGALAVRRRKKKPA